jgi:DNA-binding FadR family transcriptional regulator
MEVLARPVFGVLYERFQARGLSAAFWAEMDADHRRIFEAVRDGDVDGAKKATRAHLAALRPAYAAPPRPRGGRGRDRSRQDIGGNRRRG